MLCYVCRLSGYLLERSCRETARYLARLELTETGMRMTRHGDSNRSVLTHRGDIHLRETPLAL